jgi:hypothetical protein
LNCGRRLENNFRRGTAVIKAEPANETYRFWNFNETKTAVKRETVVEQMRDFNFESESPDRRAVPETVCGENSDFTTNTKTFGTAKISNHFPTVSTHQTIVSNEKVGTVYNNWETIVP